MRAALAQLRPSLLEREKTLARVVAAIHEAAREGAQLVCFGEALVPGYPFWVERTDGARFDSSVQKRFHARYLEQAVQPEAGHLDPVRRAAAEHGLVVVLGAVERAADRGGHSLYCTLFTIDRSGTLVSRHRKLMPTYEERLVWSPGDGAGLVTHALGGGFVLGALNCWENWMPLARAALHGQGENVHVAAWPGSARNTAMPTPFLAREGRSYVLSVSGLLHGDDLPPGFPERDSLSGWLAEGGSCAAGPDGAWLLEPVAREEGVFMVELDLAEVYRERQNFDPSGHYARPDILELVVDREPQQTVRVRGDGRAGRPRSQRS